MSEQESTAELQISPRHCIVAFVAVVSLWIAFGGGTLLVGRLLAEPGRPDKKDNSTSRMARYAIQLQNLHGFLAGHCHDLGLIERLRDRAREAQCCINRKGHRAHLLRQARPVAPHTEKTQNIGEKHKK